MAKDGRLANFLAAFVSRIKELLQPGALAWVSERERRFRCGAGWRIYGQARDKRESSAGL